MKKYVSMLMVIVLAVMLTSVNTAAETNVCTYLALGDSISTGFGLETEAECFTSIVADSGGYVLCNHAKDGATSDDVLNLIAGGGLDDTIEYARLITLTAGGNDLMHVLYELGASKYNENADVSIEPSDVLNILANSSDSRRLKLASSVLSVLNGGSETLPFAESEPFEEALSLFEQNLSGIISYIRKINTDVKIVVATQFNPYKDFSGLLSGVSKGIDKGVKRLNEVIIKSGEDNGFDVAYVYSAFEESEEDLCNADSKTMNFDFHPNSEGHKVIADCVNAVIEVKAENDISIADEWVNPFKDVSQSDWFYDAVRYVNANNLINGVESDCFGPFVFMSRAMLVTVLYRLDGMPAINGKGNFNDVVSGSYYEDAVSWAYENGIVNGYSDTEFAPYHDVTREQIAAIMFRYAQYKGVAPVGAWAIRLNYTDLADISDYAVEAVMFCTMKNIMSGRDGKLFAPKDRATRVEFAKALMNFAVNTAN